MMKLQLELIDITPPDYFQGVSSIDYPGKYCVYAMPYEEDLNPVTLYQHLLGLMDSDHFARHSNSQVFQACLDAWNIGGIKTDIEAYPYTPDEEVYLYFVLYESEVLEHLGLA